LVEQNRIDYIYDYVSIEDGEYQHLRNPFIENELMRLEHIAHLGLVNKTNKLARHNKLEHAYGTYWISKLCLENTHGLVGDKHAFLIAALLHSIGHLPFSYDAEHSLARLSLFHKPTQQRLNQLFDSVATFAGSDVITAEAQKMKDNPFYASLHCWFASYKIANSMGNPLGKKVVECWLNSDSIENQLLAELDKIDYVLRDMHYAGLGRIELNFIPIMKQFKKGSTNQLEKPPIVDFIESTHDYLCDQLYFLPERGYLAQVLDQWIAKKIIDESISFDELLNMTDDKLEGKFISPTGEIVPVFLNALKDIKDKKYQEICRVVCDCQDKSFLDIEKDLAATNISAVNNYCDTKGLHIQVIPKPNYGDLVEYQWTDSGVLTSIGYNFNNGNPKHAIKALLTVENWAPDNTYGLELTCREDALRFLVGLDVKIHFERYQEAVRPIILKFMPDPESEWDSRLFNKTWKLGQNEGIIEDLLYAYGTDWPVTHFLEFPEHWSTEMITKVLQGVGRAVKSRRLKGESDDAFQTRKEILYEYSTYLNSMLTLRQDKSGWVIPSTTLLKENGELEAEFDVVCIYIPRSHDGPVTLEIREVSKNDSDDNREKNRRKLNHISHRVEQRFGKRVQTIGLFNGEVVTKRN